ncbi:MULTISPECIES: PIG-L deacetylase family protein [Pseudomonas]|uniref:PIG-L family deacetylase n=1 Tax=Pseudomonas donghuensis TaxID=1163398 RepID=A0AAP0XAJ2_9PSED|nr:MULTISPECIES: PIG-L family deacetylase [Pseudomonas]MDF9893994.1 LmbE family N-acetylglucosaminyl deacetylase [Pseudomonas vranovensis]KDO00443.1 PIG-L family deacetylase [Pseudomonas donghuensis]MBF4210692.1 PIG-L family deacetylase [Pseudomonas donghuensis]MCP6693772.1 PIG-L family deacetylase [Pseudomonas donghuensis]MCP6697494.1 PIG-L family deacetylase [Pseudomonas donghuensis]
MTLQRPQNPIQAPGTPLAHWQSSTTLQAVPAISHDQLVPRGGRLVVVAPHPDDEVLGCGGVLAGMRGREQDLLLISVSDGEASHPDSRHWTSERLRQQRPRESADALRRLGLDLTRLSWLRLGLADGAVANHERWLAERLVQLLRASDRVLTTWRLDGHCDHEAVGRACARACETVGARLIEVPIWAWHWARPSDPRLPWQRAHKLFLDRAVLALKQQAVAAHTSQLQADEQTPPVLDREALARLLQPFELVFT